jgi:hypothetical protein
MSSSKSPSQNQLLLYIAACGGKAWLNELSPSLAKAAIRSELKVLGFTTESKEKDPTSSKGRAKIRLTLTAKAWEYLFSNPSLGPTAAAQTLHMVLERLLTVLAQKGTTLEAFFLGTSELSHQKLDPEKVYKLLKDFKAQKKTTGVTLKLSEIRKHLNIPTPAMDAALIELHRQHRLVLVPVDDPSTLSDDDRLSALNLKGVWMHQIFLT